MMVSIESSDCKVTLQSLYSQKSPLYTVISTFSRRNSFLLTTQICRIVVFGLALGTSSIIDRSISISRSNTSQSTMAQQNATTLAQTYIDTHANLDAAEISLIKRVAQTVEDVFAVQAPLNRDLLTVDNIQALVTAHQYGLARFKHVPVKLLNDCVEAQKKQQSGGSAYDVVRATALNPGFNTPIVAHKVASYFRPIILSALRGTAPAPVACNKCAKNTNRRFRGCLIFTNDEGTEEGKGACLSCAFNAQHTSCSLHTSNSAQEKKGHDETANDEQDKAVAQSQKEQTTIVRKHDKQHDSETAEKVSSRAEMERGESEDNDMTVVSDSSCTGAQKNDDGETLDTGSGFNDEEDIADGHAIKTGSSYNKDDNDPNVVNTGSIYHDQREGEHGNDDDNTAAETDPGSMAKAPFRITQNMKSNILLRHPHLRDPPAEDEYVFCGPRTLLHPSEETSEEYVNASVNISFKVPVKAEADVITSRVMSALQKIIEGDALPVYFDQMKTYRGSGHPSLRKRDSALASESTEPSGKKQKTTPSLESSEW